jgi:hypothetical protein
VDVFSGSVSGDMTRRNRRRMIGITVVTVAAGQRQDDAATS